jgi:hypothetical protein
VSSAQRIVVLVLVVVVAAIGFVVLKPDDDSDSGSPGTGTTAAPATTAPAGTGARRAARARPRPAAPPVPEIVVRGGEPVGGVKKIELHKGDTIRFTVVSDQPDHVHLHGYDVEKHVAPGEPARFAVPADIEGIFEAELHSDDTQIASITVEP